jgi:GT2 family glycosyltransferase
MSDLASLSIVIPTKDRPESLRRVLLHLHQTVPDAEVVVVDDGSREPVRADPPVRVVRVDPGIGQSAARNHGAAAATGDVLAFLDDDTFPVAAAWPRLLAILEATPLVWASPLLVLEDDAVPREAESSDEILEVEHLASTFLITTRAAFEIAGQFNESLTALVDYELTTRARRAGHKLVIDPRVHAIHADPRAGFRDDTLRFHNWIIETARVWGMTPRSDGPLDSWVYGVLCTALLPRRPALRWAARVMSRSRVWAAYQRLLPQRWPPGRIAEMISALAHVRAARVGVSQLSSDRAHDLCTACQQGEHSNWLIRRSPAP